jgi:uncharacterized membrane protein YfcA
VCLVAGILAGCAGIGGGLILNPALLELGFLQEVTAATTMFMVIFSSGASLFQHILYGNLDYAYAGAAILFTLVGALCSFAIIRAMRKLGRNSILVLILAVFILTGSILSPVFGLIISYRDENWWVVEGIC